MSSLFNSTPAHSAWFGVCFQCRPLATAGKDSAAEVTDQRRSFCIELWPTFPFSWYNINRNLIKVIQLSGHFPSTEQDKWRYSTINNKISVNLKNPIKKIWCSLAEKYQGNLVLFGNFLQPFHRAPISLKHRRRNAKIPHHFRENQNIKIFAT